MKRATLIGIALLFLFTASTNAMAQAGAVSKHTKSALGFSLYECSQCLGIGVNLTTPYFLSGRFAVRLSANHALLEGTPVGETENKMRTYTAFKLGLIGVGGYWNELIRLYGEGGVIRILPQDRLSAKKGWGGYGHFGFEFFMSEDAPVCYFIELGTIGSGVRAEKLLYNPFYANGFTTSVGLRAHL